MNEKLYPLQFNFMLKPRIWGGSKFKKENLSKNSDSIGEKWLTWDLEEENVNFVLSGPLRGKSLKDLLFIYGEEVVGKKNYSKFGEKFPLLIKLIDAAQNLSIQVHPDDKKAKEKHNAFGKSEAWYILDAKKGANIILGFQKEIPEDEFEILAKSGKIEHYLERIPVKKGDFFYVPAGFVHAIGEGIFLLEVAQNSDLTYRIYDYDRLDSFARRRDLHLSIAREVIDFSCKKSPQITYKMNQNVFSPVLKTSYFSIEILELTKETTFYYEHKDSFLILCPLDGDFSYFCLKGTKIEILHKLRILFLPASLEIITIKPIGKKNLRILEISL